MGAQKLFVSKKHRSFLKKYFFKKKSKKCLQKKVRKNENFQHLKISTFFEKNIEIFKC